SGAALHAQLVSGFDQPPHAVRNQRDATFARRSFNRNPNAHSFVLPERVERYLSTARPSPSAFGQQRKWPRTRRGQCVSVKAHQVNFNPSWMLRGPPVPMTGFAAATSGVDAATPNVPGIPRSLLNRIDG